MQEKKRTVYVFYSQRHHFLHIFSNKVIIPLMPAPNKKASFGVVGQTNLNKELLIIYSGKCVLNAHEKIYPFSVAVNPGRAMLKTHNEISFTAFFLAMKNVNTHSIPFCTSVFVESAPPFSK